MFKHFCGLNLLPEKPAKESEIEDIVRMLYNCNERDLEIIKATVKAMNGYPKRKR